MALPDTCAWVWRRSEYLDWMNDEQFELHNGFLWIKGKPGTGKSTLLKFLIDKIKTNHPDTTIASFFFNARGDDLEKSTIGMYRSLILQILTSIPSLQNLLELVEPKIDYNTIQSWDSTRLKQYFHRNDSTVEWTSNKLQFLFHSIVKKLAETAGKLICFVDALDECEEEEVRDMVDVFEQLGDQAACGTSVSFRTCFSSRHYPHITIERMVTFILEDQDGHDQDLKLYVDNKLRIGKSDQSMAIKRNIIARSSGIFLWVVLVVQLLRRDYDRGLVHKLQERLDEAPSGLQALFDDILVQEGALEPESILCLQFVMFARRPLDLAELYYGIRTAVDDEADLEIQWGASQITEDDIARYILSISKGLVEIVTSCEIQEALQRLRVASDEEIQTAPWTTAAQSVQLIHESVRQFLIEQWSSRSYFGGPGSITV